MFKLIRIPSVLLLCLFSSVSFSEVSSSQEKLLENLPPDQRAAIMKEMKADDNLQNTQNNTFEQTNTLVERPEPVTQDLTESCKECIYGYDFFKYSPSTFAPSNNIPISSTYILGPGDELSISYFGSHNNQSAGFISREGILDLPLLLPVNLLGMTYAEAVALIERKVNSELLGTNVSITLKDLRSISIYLLGQAYKPGNYTLSGLSTVTNALFSSGGVNKLGSLRNIEIRRGGETIKVYDFYEFLLKGETNSDIRLQDGDIIFIPYIQKKVKVGNGFKGPHLYEIKSEETVADIIDMAGGFSSMVGSNAKLELGSSNIDTNDRSISYLSQEPESLSRKLRDGDTINISKNISLFVGTIEMAGEVNLPGEYSILKGDTVLDLIERAGGYSDNSFSEGAIFLREDVAKLQKEGNERSAAELEDYMLRLVTKGTAENMNESMLMPISSLITKLRNDIPLGRQVVDLDYLRLKTDPALNFRLQDGDFLFIPKRPESVSIIGEVYNPSVQRYTPSLSLMEYIGLSGGVKDSADVGNIFVVLPNGKTLIQNKRFFSKKHSLLPGSTIVVTRENYSGMELAVVLSPILSNFATSAVALAILNKDRNYIDSR